MSAHCPLVQQPSQSELLTKNWSPPMPKWHSTSSTSPPILLYKTFPPGGSAPNPAAAPLVTNGAGPVQVDSNAIASAGSGSSCSSSSSSSSSFSSSSSSSFLSFLSSRL